MDGRPAGLREASDRTLPGASAQRAKHRAGGWAREGGVAPRNAVK